MKKKTTSEIVKKYFGDPLKNICRSFYDSFVKENAEFRAKAGLKTTIIRKSAGKCCKWCNEVAGEYPVGNAPEGIYRRHNNCNCHVYFKSEKGVQDVHTKKWVQETPDEVLEKRKTIGLEDVGVSGKVKTREYKQLTEDEYKKLVENVKIDEITYAKLLGEKARRAFLSARQAACELDGYSGYIQTTASMKINRALRGGKGKQLQRKYKNTIEVLDDLIEKSTIPYDMKAVRYTGTQLMDSLEEMGIGVGDIAYSKGYMSVSAIPERNLFRGAPVAMKINIPKGTRGFVTKNLNESEIILGRGTKYRIDAIKEGVNEYKRAIRILEVTILE